MPCASSKSITPCNCSFVEQVLDYLQEDLSNIDSGNDCTVRTESQHRICWGRVSKPKKVYSLQISTQTYILSISSCIVLEHNMNYGIKIVYLSTLFNERVKNKSKVLNLCLSLCECCRHF
jgi:hypothetical protein